MLFFLLFLSPFRRQQNTATGKYCHVGLLQPTTRPRKLMIMGVPLEPWSLNSSGMWLAGAGVQYNTRQLLRLVVRQKEKERGGKSGSINRSSNWSIDWFSIDFRIHRSTFGSIHRFSIDFGVISLHFWRLSLVFCSILQNGNGTKMQFWFAWDQQLQWQMR